MIEADLAARLIGGTDAEAPGDRSLFLVANAERDRLERVLRELPSALVGSSRYRVAEGLVGGACLLSHARVGWVVLPDPDSIVVSGGPDAAWVAADAEPGRWPIVALALGGTAVHEPVPGQPATSLDGRPLRSLCSFPLFGESVVRGALVLAHHRAGAFSERQVALVEALAGIFGQALELCEAVEEKSRVAAALQETLLPPVLPPAQGIDLAARYRPSGSGNLVGGDFYDVFTDGAGGWYVLLGDSCGIGPEAAGLTGVARYTARALAESASGPGEMLVHMNRALLRAAPDDRFCTAVLAHLRSHEDGVVRVQLASAGHPPPLVQRAEGPVEVAMDHTGLVLGVLADASIGEVSLVLEPGDALACYTDGVIEAHGENGAEFGEERLVEVLAAARGRSADGIARRIEREVVDYRNPEDGDDLAVVVLRCRPPPDLRTAPAFRTTLVSFAGRRGQRHGSTRGSSTEALDGDVQLRRREAGEP